MTGILNRLGSSAERWQARLEKLKGGRLLGRFFAASRDRLREVAARLKVHHLANLERLPGVIIQRDLQCTAAGRRRFDRRVARRIGSLRLAKRTRNGRVQGRAMRITGAWIGVSPGSGASRSGILGPVPGKSFFLVSGHRGSLQMSAQGIAYARSS